MILGYAHRTYTAAPDSASPCNQERQIFRDMSIQPPNRPVQNVGAGTF